MGGGGKGGRKGGRKEGGVAAGGEEKVVLYQERDGIAINRPDKKNTLTDAVIQGIADGVDRAWQDYGEKPVVGED